MDVRSAGSRIALALMLTPGAIVYSHQAPVFSASGPDAEAYGAAQHYPVGSGASAFEKQYLVGSLSHFASLFPTHTIAPATHAWEFHHPAEAQDISYFHGGSRYLLSEYLAHLPVTGLLIAKDDQILFEGYQYDRKDRDRFTSESMAKTIVAMLVGEAMADDAIASTSDPAFKYIPELKGSAFGKVTVLNLLHMSSGVTCESGRSMTDSTSLADLEHNCRQAFPQGTQFQYSAADAEVLGLIVARSTKRDLARYLHDKIWQNIGTESEATWTIDDTGHETPYCCFNATLRDYARFGRLLAYNGAWNGRQLIPSQWLLDATTVKDSDRQLLPGKPARFFGYGYQTWIFPGPRRMFVLLGAHGQRIFVDPQSKLVMVQTAAMVKDVDPPKDAETIGLWLSLVHRYGKE